MPFAIPVSTERTLLISFHGNTENSRVKSLYDLFFVSGVSQINLQINNTFSSIFSVRTLSFFHHFLFFGSLTINGLFFNFTFLFIISLVQSSSSTVNVKIELSVFGVIQLNSIVSLLINSDFSISFGSDGVL